jgi:DNA polymerase-4
LAPQPVSILFGIGKATIKKLHSAGYHSCADLVSANELHLAAVLGSQTRQIMALAKGIDQRPVTPRRVAKSVSNETTFSRDLSDFTDLEAALERLCSKLAKRLKASQLSGATVTLKLKRSDHRIITRSYSLDTPTDKAHLLFDVGRQLLARETKKQLFYRLLGIGVSHLDNVKTQTLFDRNGGVDDKRNRLEAATDQLQGKLGDHIIQSGRQFSRHHFAADDDDTV